MSRSKGSKSSTAQTIAPAACPCGLPTPYEQCCGRLHRGEAAAGTAEELMRSRYSAFVRRDAGYLLRSWHSDTRPAGLSFDADDPEWVRLEVLGSTDGGPFHSEGTVEFRAHFRDRGRPGVMRERSRFVRENGAWVYLDGEVA